MIGQRILTGDKCPTSGIWRSEGKGGKTAIVKRQDELMPSHRNSDVSWRMIQHLPKQ